ncbi:MAG: Rrf2 family transcriptional regulator [Alphaproteobacteria bacterium]
MHFSTRGRYAVMAMLDLAEMSVAGARDTKVMPVTLAQIAERQRISLSYLEQLFGKLRKNKVVSSTRGPGGGYVLARVPAEITLADVIDAVEEDLDITRCKTLYKLEGIHPLTGQVLEPVCAGGRKCNSHDLWAAMGAHMQQFLTRVTLQMVLDGEVGVGHVPSPVAAVGTKVRIN